MKKNARLISTAIFFTVLLALFGSSYLGNADELTESAGNEVNGVGDIDTETIDFDKSNKLLETFAIGGPPDKWIKSNYSELDDAPAGYQTAPTWWTGIGDDVMSVFGPANRKAVIISSTPWGDWGDSPIVYPSNRERSVDYLSSNGGSYSRTVQRVGLDLDNYPSFILGRELTGTLDQASLAFVPYNAYGYKLSFSDDQSKDYNKRLPLVGEGWGNLQTGFMLNWSDMLTAEARKNIKDIKYLEIVQLTSEILPGTSDKKLLLLPLVYVKEGYINVKDRTIKQGDKFIPGGNIIDEDGRYAGTAAIIENTVNVDVPGEYKITYEGYINKGKLDEFYMTKTITVTVEAATPEIIAEDREVTIETGWDEKRALEDVKARLSLDYGSTIIDLTKDIKIVEDDVNIKRAGTYHVKYQVTSYGVTSEKEIAVTVKLVPTLLRLLEDPNLPDQYDTDEKTKPIKVEYLCSEKQIYPIIFGRLNGGDRMAFRMIQEYGEEISDSDMVYKYVGSFQIPFEQLSLGKNSFSVWASNNLNSEVDAIEGSINIIHQEAEPNIQKVPLNGSLNLEIVDDVLKSHNTIHDPILTLSEGTELDTTGTGFQWVKVNVADSETPEINNIDIDVPVNVYSEETTVINDDALLAIDAKDSSYTVQELKYNLFDQLALLQEMKNRSGVKAWSMDDGSEIPVVTQGSSIKPEAGKYSINFYSSKGKSKVEVKPSALVSGNFRIESVPNSIEFEDATIQTKTTYVNKTCALPFQVENSLGVEDWTLKVKASDFLDSDGNPVSSILVNKKAGFEEVVDKENSSVILEAQGADGSSFMEEMSENEGLVLKVNPGQVKAREYKAEVTWTLENTPF